MLILMLPLLTFITGCAMSEVSVPNKIDSNRGSEVQQAQNQDHVDWNAFYNEGMGYDAEK
jgi:hypothetical protein